MSELVSRPLELTADSTAPASNRAYTCKQMSMRAKKKKIRARERFACALPPIAPTHPCFHPSELILIASHTPTARFALIPRPHFAFPPPPPRCIRRRAELSVAMNPTCRSKGAALAAVERAWKVCSVDYAPFDRAV